jgi:hypothetical protein
MENEIRFIFYTMIIFFSLNFLSGYVSRTNSLIVSLKEKTHTTIFEKTVSN